MNLDDYTTLDPEGEFSDCTIECGGQVFKVHKVFVCTQSPVFRAALVGGFKVIKAVPASFSFFFLLFFWARSSLTLLQEGATNKYTIVGFDVDIAKRMIRFLYGDKDVWPQLPKLPKQSPVPNSKKVDSSGDNDNAESDKATEDTADPKTLHVTTLIKMCNIAEYFGITKMQEAGRAEINDFFDSDPANWCAVVFNKAAKLVVSESGDKDLHNIFASLAAQHVADYKAFDMTTLMALDDFLLHFMCQVNQTIEEEATRITFLKRSNEKQMKEMEKAINEASNAGQCSNWDCPKKTGWLIKKDDITLKYHVRCKNCNAKFGA